MAQKIATFLNKHLLKSSLTEIFSWKIKTEQSEHSVWKKYLFILQSYVWLTPVYIVIRHIQECFLYRTNFFSSVLGYDKAVSLSWQYTLPKTSLKISSAMFCFLFHLLFLFTSWNDLLCFCKQNLSTFKLCFNFWILPQPYLSGISTTVYFI